MPLISADWTRFLATFSGKQPAVLSARWTRWLDTSQRAIKARPSLVVIFEFSFQPVEIRLDFNMDLPSSRLVRLEQRLQWETQGEQVDLEKFANQRKPLIDACLQAGEQARSTSDAKPSSKLSKSEMARTTLTHLHKESGTLVEGIGRAMEQLHNDRTEGNVKPDKHIQEAERLGKWLRSFIERYEYQLAEHHDGMVEQLFQALKTEMLTVIRKKYEGKLKDLRKPIPERVQRVDREKLLQDRELMERSFAALDCPGNSSESRVSQCYLRLARQLYAVMAKVPVSRFEFSGFGNIEFEELNFDKSLSDNMLAYLKNQKLDHLLPVGQKLRSHASIQYILTASRLFARAPLEPKELFCQVHDMGSPDTSMPTVEGLETQLTASPVLSTFKGELQGVYMRVLSHYTTLFSMIAEAIEAFGKLRLALLSPDRQRVIVQRALQSGDSNGVAFALCAFNEYQLLYMFDFGDEAKAESNLKFYEAMGIARERITLVALKKKSIDNPVPVASKFKGYQPKIIYFPGGTNALYQYIITKNKHYLKDKPELRVLMDVAFHFEKNIFSEVGRSTSLVRHFIKGHEEKAHQICKKIYWALNKQIQFSDRDSISKYTTGFLEKLLSHYAKKKWEKPWHQGMGLKPEKDETPLLILFWIRGPQGEEGHFSNLSFNNKTQTYVPTVGKPWHHATYQLLVTMRQLAANLAEELKAPVCLVPIGDELSTDFHHATVLKQKEKELKTKLLEQFEKVRAGFLSFEDTVELEQRETTAEQEGLKKLHESMPPPKLKRKKEHNLIKFFEDLPAFSNRNRFNQLYFIYNLFARQDIRVVQVGLRSGALEQGMYLGVPTVYIDIEQENLQLFKAGEPDTRKRMMDMTAKEGGFPQFHCLESKNVIGVNPSAISLNDKQDLHMRFRKDARSQEASNDQHLFKGTLRVPEAETMEEHLRKIYTGYTAYFDTLKPHNPPTDEPKLTLDSDVD